MTRSEGQPAGGALAQEKGDSVYPQIVDTSHASHEASAFFASFFTAKSRHDVGETMKHSSPYLVTYTDATLGWPLDGFDAVKANTSRLTSVYDGRRLPDAELQELLLLSLDR